MSDFIAPNYQHTSTKINEAMPLIRLFKHFKTQKSHQQKVRCSWKLLDFKIIMEEKQQSRKVQNKWWWLRFCLCSTSKYFDSLEILKDNLVARPTKSNLEDNDSSLSNLSIYSSDNPSSAKSVRKMVKGQKSNVEEVMATVTNALEKISWRYVVCLQG